VVAAARLGICAAA